jgi:methylated-DNA-[protein]-cysteine S-methyltransferase
MSSFVQRVVSSPVGLLRLVATDTALTGVYFGASDRDLWAATPAPKRHAMLDRAVRELKEYFSGKRQSFSLPLAAAGTEFQRAVWKALTAIPYGKCWSYGDVAKKIGRPQAARAVGAAIGANPISIIVPCHRVIGADGSLTGFGGGLPAKGWLLSHEAHAADGAKRGR